MMQAAKKHPVPSPAENAKRHWSLDDIAWQAFDGTKITPELVSLVKAASIVEHNGHDYGRYLCEVFAGDELFQQAARNWAKEEVQHGMALRKWAALADPSFDFDKRFAVFTDGYQLPAVSASVRGSRSGELIARCVVEIGTSYYYTALKDYTSEPVLKELCAKIAADELRHYKLFYTHLQRYLAIEKPNLLQRIKVGISRITESEDDELSYAFYAAHRQDVQDVYNRKLCANRYWSCLGMFYRKRHVDQMMAMAFKTIGLRPNSLLNRIANHIAWRILQLRMSRFAALKA